MHFAPFISTPLRPYPNAVPADKRSAQRPILATRIVEKPAFRAVSAIPSQVLLAQLHAFALILHHPCDYLKRNRGRKRRRPRSTRRNSHIAALFGGFDEASGVFDGLQRGLLLLDGFLCGVSSLALFPPSTCQLFRAPTCEFPRGSFRSWLRSDIWRIITKTAMRILFGNELEERGRDFVFAGVVVSGDVVA